MSDGIQQGFLNFVKDCAYKDGVRGHAYAPFMRDNPVYPETRAVYLRYYQMGFLQRKWKEGHTKYITYYFPSTTAEAMHQRSAGLARGKLRLLQGEGG